MSKPRTNQGTPDKPEPTVDRKPPQDKEADREIQEDALASASTTRDPTIINRFS